MVLGYFRRKKESKLGKSSSPQLPIRCQICQNLDKAATPFHVEHTSLASSADAGCASCELLRTVIDPYGYDELQAQEAPLRCLIDVAKLGRNLRIQFTSAAEPHGVQLQIYTTEDTSCPWPSITRYPEELGNTHPEPASRQIETWLEQCSAEHSCLDSSFQPLLPTRVLMIHGPKQVSLHEPQVEERAQYACLSHCWGGSVPIQTNSSTQNEFRHGIQWEKLPPTFQHAIDMTNRLGLRYLWIDSLCIVQDDINDWRHEGSRMASIYSQAYITFAATNATNSQQGFYNAPYRPQHDRTYTFKTDSGSSYSISVRLEEASLEFELATLPLLLRGWFFQERLLSPRVVHFANDMLYWECFTSLKGERDVVVDSSFPKGYMVTGNHHSRSFDPPQEKEVLNIEAVKWHEIVQEYSKKQLTFSKDVFPALQGVASYTQRERKCRYYAGLWEDNIIYDLLWRTTFPAHETPAKYHAPSWSWASRTRGVMWLAQSEDFQPHAEIVSISTTPAGADPMGEIIAGTLTVRGICIPAVIKPASSGTPELSMRPGDTSQDVSFFRFWTWSPDFGISVLGGQAVTMILMGTGSSTAYFLVLMQVNTCEEMFERVGFIQTSYLAAKEIIVQDERARVITIV